MINVLISNYHCNDAPILEKYVRKIKKKKWGRMELKLNMIMGSYEPKNSKLYLGIDVNILPKKLWVLMSKFNLVRHQSKRY